MYSMLDFSEDKWNEKLASFQKAHVLQTVQWGQIKTSVGWKPDYKAWKDSQGKTVALAMILKRSLKLSRLIPEIEILYVPKGPVLDWDDHDLYNQVLTDLENHAKSEGVLFIKIDPDVETGYGKPDDPGVKVINSGDEVKIEMLDRGWRFSNDQIQYKNSMVIDLSPDLEVILSKMKQKTRYNIRLAGRKGVVITEGSEDDFDLLYDMYAETAMRDGFVIRDRSYYKKTWSTFINSEMALPLIAKFEGMPIAGIVPYFFAGKAWFLFGMSLNKHRDKMPNYLLQWSVISKAKSLGCTAYDLWGAPDIFEPEDPMWGVYKFKAGFNAQVVRRIGAWDFVLKPTFYQIYTTFLPKILNVLRLRGKTRIQQDLS